MRPSCRVGNGSVRQLRYPWQDHAVCCRSTDLPDLSRCNRIDASARRKTAKLPLPDRSRIASHGFDAKSTYDFTRAAFSEFFGMLTNVLFSGESSR
jgi:hypothetical protein